MNIAVYCGASKGNDQGFSQATKALGQWIAEQNHTLIYGGGKAGLMGVLADAVLQSGGHVIGVIPDFLQNRELAHQALSELHVVGSMSERKRMMFDFAEAFIALPGGPGTLEEITEMISWSRIGQNPHPCMFYDINGFYQATRTVYDQMVAQGFLTQDDRDKIGFATTTEEVADFIDGYQPPALRTYI